MDDLKRHRSGWWCHMVSDRSVEELHAFASEMGLRRGWFQGGRHPHYDLRPPGGASRCARGPRRSARGSSSGGWRAAEASAPWDPGLVDEARDFMLGQRLSEGFGWTRALGFAWPTATSTPAPRTAPRR